MNQHWRRTRHTLDAQDLSALTSLAGVHRAAAFHKLDEAAVERRVYQLMRREADPGEAQAARARHAALIDAAAWSDILARANTHTLP